jgi:hypothetical protein
MPEMLAIDPVTTATVHINLFPVRRTPCLLLLTTRRSLPLPPRRCHLHQLTHPPLPHFGMLVIVVAFSLNPLRACGAPALPLSDQPPATRSIQPFIPVCAPGHAKPRMTRPSLHLPSFPPDLHRLTSTEQRCTQRCSGPS